MTAYTDAQRVRTITLQLGQLGLYITQLVGLLVAAWVMSPKLTLIGILFAILGASVVLYFALSLLPNRVEPGPAL